MHEFYELTAASLFLASAYEGRRPSFRSLQRFAMELIIASRGVARKELGMGMSWIWVFH